MTENVVPLSSPIPGEKQEVREAVVSADDAFENAEPVKSSLHDRVEELAAMDPLAYLEISKAVAKEYDIPASELTRAVKKARGDKDDSIQGEAFTIDTPDPWHEPVDGDALADGLREQIERYVWLPDGAAAVVTLWILHTYVFDAWRISPRLFITSPVKGCGKSTLLNGIIGRTVYKPLLASNVGAAVLFRSTARWRPTLVIDEVDSFMRQDEDLRGIVNSSHTIDGGVLRCVGDDHEVRRFSTWAPMAFAGIGKVADTIEDRSIVIQLQRRSAAESVADIDGAALAKFETWTRKAVRWAEGMEQTLADYRPEMPDGMANRLADNWRPILTMADEVGGDWPHMARDAARAYHSAQEETSAAVQVLLDISAMFEAQQTDKLASTFIVERLGKMEDRPWGEWKNSKPITVHALGRLLGRFDIKPDNKSKNAVGKQFRGYERGPIVENAARYAPKNNVQAGDPLTQSVKASKTNKNNGLGDEQSVNAETQIDALKIDNSLKNNDIDTLTLRNPLDRDTETFEPQKAGSKDEWHGKT